jgi:4-hydroxy-tetrahydrodipicolinate synthase
VEDFYFSGLGVALVTPFGSDGTPDLPALRNLVEHVIAGGVDYLVPMGTTGESATLTADEQLSCLDVVFEANAGRKPIVLGCGGNDTAAVCHKIGELTRRYRPQGFLSVSPYYNKPTQAGILAHYGAVAQATHLPILLYNVPGRTASNVAAPTVVELANRYPNIVGVKEASGDLEQGMLICRDAPKGFAVISGDDTLALPQVASGYCGCISVVGNVVPNEYSRLIHLAQAGDFAAARPLQYALLNLMKLLFAEGNPAGAKAALAALGICRPFVRLPLVSASEALSQQLAEALRVLGYETR